MCLPPEIDSVPIQMSKSSGEFLTLTRLGEIGYSPMVYRFFCLQSHYRKQLVYSDEAIEHAKSAYDKLIKRLVKLDAKGETIDEAKCTYYKEKFAFVLGNDLNTSYALTILFDVLKDEEINDDTKLYLVADFDRVLSLNLTKAKEQLTKDEPVEIDSEFKAYVEDMIERRKQAKLNRDYAQADSIRNELANKGIELIDTKDGTTYKLKN